MGQKYLTQRGLKGLASGTLYTTLYYNLQFHAEDAVQPLKYEFIKLVLDHLRSALKPEQAASERDRDQYVRIFSGVIRAVVCAAVSGEKNKELMVRGIADLMALEQDFMRSSKEFTPSNIIQIVERIEEGFQFSQYSVFGNNAMRKRLCRWALDQVVIAFCQYPKDLPSLDRQASLIDDEIAKLEQSFREKLQAPREKLQAFRADLPKTINKYRL